MNIRNRVTEMRLMSPKDISFNERNWRMHPDKQNAALTAILEQIGIAGAMLCYYSERNGGKLTLIDGHLRKEIAPGEQWPVLITDLTDSEADTLLAAYDPISAMAGADKERLDSLLREVHVDDARLQEMLADLAKDNGLYQTGDNKDAEPQIDKAEELRVKWGVESGQLWEMGDHRLLCGDSTKAEDVARVMGEYKAAITFTSPPYNAGISAKLRGNTSIKDNLYKDEYNDNKSQDEYLALLIGFTDKALIISDYVFVNIQFLAGNKIAFIDYLNNYKKKLADIAIWDKQRAAPAAALRVMDSRFEFIVVFSHSATRAIGTREFRGMVHNVYSGQPQTNNEYASSHAATFPVDFPVHFIKTFTNIGELVFEPFCGTGTTIIACENNNRKCRAIDISPAYVAVALQRWADATGKTPKLIE